MLQSLNYLCGPLLNSLQDIQVTLVLGNPALDQELQIYLTSAEHRRRITFLDLLAMLSQDAIGLLYCKGTIIIRGLKHLCCEERLKKWGLFSLEKRRLQGEHIAAFQYLKGAYKEVGEGLLTRPCSDRTKGNGFKLKEVTFRLHIIKKFFTTRVVRH